MKSTLSTAQPVNPLRGGFSGPREGQARKRIRRPVSDTYRFSFRSK